MRCFLPSGITEKVNNSCLILAFEAIKRDMARRSRGAMSIIEYECQAETAARPFARSSSRSSVSSMPQ
ncbi:hypothetical protein, partial [Staphylococcus aureus]|uniref:hypothetical protein n=1 Tax=Staphylococcus aureus TaxID=1280 RepID=UPI0038B36215